MKCSPRSTTSFADALRLVAGLVVLLVGVSARASDEPVPPAVTAAIAEAVAGRVGPGFSVEVVEVTARLVEEATAIVAVPEPGARLETPTRFRLVEPGTGRLAADTRVGDAVATVRVSGPMVRAGRRLPRGVVLEASDLAVSESDAGDAPLGPLPAAADLVGAKTVRPIAEGELLTASLVRVPPLVSSGQLVTTIARLGRVRVEGKAVAAQQGALGQVIRLVNPDSRKTLHGTVVGPGRVEVLRER
ncbi:MAG: flagellar basal body P-ring formation chaperone FlgA [Vicinamibacterales bacterium]